jgi:hypothetical protein
MRLNPLPSAPWAPVASAPVFFDAFEGPWCLEHIIDHVHAVEVCNRLRQERSCAFGSDSVGMTDVAVDDKLGDRPRGRTTQLRARFELESRSTEA